jgi:methylase of polypeptide subunit release factors
MSIKDWLKRAEQQLAAAGIGSARLDAVILLEDEFKKDRGWLLAHPEAEISISRGKRLGSKLKKRLRHLPPTTLS